MPGLNVRGNSKSSFLFKFLQIDGIITLLLTQVRKPISLSIPGIFGTASMTHSNKIVQLYIYMQNYLFIRIFVHEFRCTYFLTCTHMLLYGGGKFNSNLADQTKIGGKKEIVINNLTKRNHYSSKFQSPFGHV